MDLRREGCEALRPVSQGWRVTLHETLGEQQQCKGKQIPIQIDVYWTTIIQQTTYLYAKSYF